MRSHRSIAQILVLLLGVFLSASLLGAETGTTDDPANNESAICNNGDHVFPVCCSDQPDTDDCSTCVDGSKIDTYGFNAHFFAWDYRVDPHPERGVTCRTCGGGSAPSAPEELPRLEIKRITRFRDFWEPSSFGLSMFSAYDIHLLLVPSGSTIGDSGSSEPIARVWDPDHDPSHYHMFYELSPDHGDNAIDGVYHDKTLRSIRSLTLYDASGAVTTQATAVTAVEIRNTGERYDFEVINTDPTAPDQHRDGRLTRIRDRNGNAITLAYRYAANATDADLGCDRSRLWQLASITDAYGNVATFAYGAAKVAGFWAVSSIGLPDGQTLTYAYAGNFLASVHHPDGTVSTFSSRVDKTTQLLVESINDPAAGEGHVRREVWTNPGSLSIGGVVVPQAAFLTRRIYNGDGELLFRNWDDPANFPVNGVRPTTRTLYVYLGGGHLERLVAQDGSTVGMSPVSVSHASAPFDPSTQFPEDQGFTLERSFGTNLQEMETSLTDVFGRVTTYQRDPFTRAFLGTTFPDGTNSTTTYNEFRQPLHKVDRLGRITDSVYDGAGNRLSRTVAVGTPAQATWHWTYNAKGQPLSATDADGNVTNYAYDAHGYLATITEPADVAGGARAVWTYAYDAIGRLQSLTDPVGRVVTYGYDACERLVDVGYPDASHERTAYGTGAPILGGPATDTNLVIATTDRDGDVTSYAYDHSTRRTGTTWATGKPEAVSEICTYLPGTQLKTSCARRGERTDYAYDQRRRLIATTVHPTATRSLTTLQAYDDFNRLVSTTDPYGRRTFTVYDINDRIARMVRELVPNGLGTANPATVGRSLVLNPPYVIEETSFDAQGELLSRHDGRNHATSYLYDAQGRQIAVTEGADVPSVAGTTSTIYDAQGNRLRVTRPNGAGFITSYAYTGRNLVASMTEGALSPIAATTRYTYTLTRKLATKTDARSHTTIYQYCVCCDRLEEIDDPLGFATTFTYTPAGDPLATTDANGNTISRTYDGLHRIIMLTNGAGETTTTTYDDNLADGIGLDALYAAQIAGLGFGAGADGMATLVTDPLGESTLTISDGLGRVVRIVDPLGHARTTTYDVVVGGLVETAMIDALGHTTRHRLDGLGHERQTVDAENHVATSGFDASGNRARTRDANGVGTDCAFDARNRQTGCTDTHGDHTGTSYDRDSNLIATIDGLGASTTMIYDVRDRKTQVTDRIGAITKFAYDAVSNLTRITDAQGGVTTYTYDARDLLVQEQFPPESAGVPDIRRYSYDPGRRLSTRVDQTGATTRYGYDRADRLLTRIYPDAKNDVFTYDHASRLTSAVSKRYTNTVSRVYDAASRLAKESLTVPGSPEQGTTVRYDVFYGYDAANRETSLAYPDGTVARRSYTARNLLSGVTFGGASVATRGYDAGGRLIKTTYGNSLVESRAYRAGDNLIATMGVPGVTGFSYTYDADQRALSEADSIVPAQGQTFGYDAQDRLTSWHRSSGDTQTWSLSPVGDWNSTVIDGTTQTRTHDAVHEITHIDGQPLSYDKKGNLAADNAGQSYTWDVENRLATATTPDANAHYAYDALGRRVQKTVDDLTTTFVSAGAQEIWEVDTDQSVYTAEGENGGPATPTRPLGGVLDGTNITRVNFQPATSTVPAGFIADTGAQFGLRASGATYGWRGAAQPYTARANRVALLNFDTNDAMQPAGKPAGTWDYALPNGNYPVVVVMGDAAHLDMVNNVSIEGQAQVDPDPFDSTHDYGYQLGDFDGYAVIAHVADGKLTIAPGSGASNAKICFVEIGPAGGTIDATTQQRLADMVKRLTEATAGTPPKMAVRANVYGSYIDEPLAIVSNGVHYYLHPNRLYSVAAATDASGTIAERYKYDAYGKRSVTSGSGASLTATAIGNEWGFTGRRHDEETGLVYMRARYMSPTLGRFISRDPIKYKGGGFNLYADYFVPNKLDPRGTVCCKHCGQKPYNYPDAGNGGRCPSDAHKVDDSQCPPEECTCSCGSWKVFYLGFSGGGKFHVVIGGGGKVRFWKARCQCTGQTKTIMYGHSITIEVGAGGGGEVEASGPGIGAFEGVTEFPEGESEISTGGSLSGAAGLGGNADVGTTGHSAEVAVTPAFGLGWSLDFQGTRTTIDYVGCDGDDGGF